VGISNCRYTVLIILIMKFYGGTLGHALRPSRFAPRVQRNACPSWVIPAMQPLSFTTIESFDSVHEANVAVAVLAENGIDCFTENATLIANDWLLAGAVGGVKVQVPLSQASIAREVLDAWRKSRADRVDAGKDQWIVFRCSGCRELIAIGAENANRVENCPLCRRYVDVPA
jgi:hypothetical protein